MQAGLDGVLYEFISTNDQCAYVWSPERNSRNYKLITVVGLLKEIAIAEVENINLNKEGQIKDVLIELNNDH